MTHAVLEPDTIERISADVALAEQYRQAVVNHQVADLLDVRALSAATPGQAAMWQHRAAQRRAMGDRILRQVLEAAGQRTRVGAGRPVIARSAARD